MSTIKDVAKYANVSIATVSRVINEVQNVSPKTVKKVQDAIKELDYIPNGVARNLKSERSKTVGLLVSDIANSYFAVMAKTLEAELRKAGYDMLICSTNEDAMLEEKYINRFLSNQGAGMILNPTGQNCDLIETISQKLPVVLIERRFDMAGFVGDYVGANNCMGVYKLTEYLLENGHRDIAIINGRMNVNTGFERFNGFKDAMYDYGISIENDYIYRYDAAENIEKEGYKAAKYFMNLSKKPTAIIGGNNILTIGLYKYLKGHHINVPDDISIMGYGNIENCELFFVEPSYVTLNPVSIGKRASQYLVSRIETVTQVNREAIFESQLILGDSVSARII